MKQILLLGFAVAAAGCGQGRESSPVLHVQGPINQPEFAWCQQQQKDGAWVKQGLMVVFYKNGGVEAIQNVENNILNGPAWEFWPDGKPSTAGQYSNGKPSGVWRIWKQDGTFSDKNVDQD